MEMKKIHNQFEDKICAECGKQATYVVWDMYETIPIIDDKGRKWRSWKRIRDPHWLCDNHKRISKSYYTDGTYEIMDDDGRFFIFNADTGALIKEILIES